MDTQALTIALIVLGALVSALAVAVELLWREQRRGRIADPTAHAVADALRAGQDERALGELLGYLEDVNARVQALAEHARTLDAALAQLRERSRSHLQRVGVVRFDASESVSGRLSCALCILDAQANGFLITTLYDLEHSRTFVRAVRAGRTAKELLEAERQALQMALAGGLSESEESEPGEDAHA
ncbi:MAG: DUF4446 family protein [Armatimonadota bacterium]